MPPANVLAPPRPPPVSVRIVYFVPIVTALPDASCTVAPPSVAVPVIAVLLAVPPLMVSR